MAGRSAKHTAFRGWVSASTAKWRALVWGDDAGGVSEHVSRLRMRAVDSYSKTSGWVTSAAFTVLENAYPTLEYVDPVDEGLLTGNEPYIVFAVDDADGDDVHVEVQLSVRPDFVGAITARSATDQTDWEESSDPYSSWTAVPEGGATAGNRVRWKSTALRYDWYYIRARATDGILTTDWLPVIRTLVTPSGAKPLTCTIGTVAYYIEKLKAYERTGGEPSPLEFDIALADHRENEVVKGASVSVGFVRGDYSRTWNGTVETVTSQGARMHIYCLQDDAYLSRKVMAGDLTSDDLGANFASMIGTYGAPLDNAEMDTSLGVSAAITGDYKPIRSPLREWETLLGFIFWVDPTGTVHLVMPDDMAAPEFILWEEFS